MRGVRRSVAASCAAALLLLAACGGGYTGLSKTDFVSQADTICKTYEAKLTAMFGHVSADTTLSEVQSIYQLQAIPVFLAEVQQLRKLKPPKADRATVAKIFDDLSTGVDQLDAQVRAAKSLKELDALAPAGLKQASGDAKAYGLVVCGTS